MNFLAHLYLSGDNEEIMVGNFMGDFVRGSNFETRFGVGIARGIEIHRAIDYFTDSHPIVKNSTARLWPNYRHYSRVIVDIFYDHFLASRWANYSSMSLEEYAKRTYQIILSHSLKLPEEVKQMIPMMIKNDWLLKYASLEGLRWVFNGMSRRASFDSKMELAVEDLILNYSLFKDEFLEFFIILKQFVSNLDSFKN